MPYSTFSRSRPVASAIINAGPRSGPPLTPTVFLGFVVACILVIIVGGLSYQAMESRELAVTQVMQTNRELQQLQQLLSAMKDAETGQRGFILTGEERYLEPFLRAEAQLPFLFKNLRTNEEDRQWMRAVDTLDQLSQRKLAELQETITMRRSGNVDGAMEMVRSDRGRLLMDEVRALIDRVDGDRRTLLGLQQTQWSSAVANSTRVTWGSCGVLLVLIIAAAVMTSRDHRAKQRQAWLRTGQMGLGEQLQGEQTLQQLGANVLDYLAAYLQVPVGALYTLGEDGAFHASAAFSCALDERVVQSGDGLLGQAAKARRALLVRDVPEGYLPVASALGHSQSRSLLLVPAIADGVVQGVLEFGFFQPMGDAELELMDRVSEALGIAVRAAKDRTRLEELLAETQAQAEELQVQQEELRVNNEELEEQGRALKESQGQMESQQAELEQINTQLEEQSQILAQQRDELVESQALLATKNDDLERINQYKSEFLANMSHELRTPLNSSLIFAKLLADNKDRNLTDEQVEFARTIYSAGNDLLALINDILDLAKIESGKVEIAVEPVSLRKLADDMHHLFTPAAAQRDLALHVDVHPTMDDIIQSDGQRLGQILKNLISNALKFTDSGEIRLQIAPTDNGRIALAVSDTGIGIAPEQHEAVFEAFRQADGSTHRKYGGTGLGLSISRDLAHLLGGELSLASAPGTGSTFTLTIPRVLEIVETPVSSIPAVAHAPAAAHQAASAAPAAPAIERPTIAPAASSPDSRTILIVEDDVAFANILRDIAIESGFNYILMHTASEGLDAARMLRPSAILLDVHLPDGNGLDILDALKSDPATRHIPVHMVSVADHTQEALGRGAIGYVLKPAEREQLVSVLKRFEAKLSQSFQRVLVIEDDERQRESIRHLLQNGDVRIVGASTAGEALQQLQQTTFDCVVMDLNLPDMSGYELLEQMAEKEQFSFPPVIVYTGRSLTRDEEQRLRRFSKSIIIKDARSPERLLDEVTLFLHQVESTLPLERQRMLKQARHREAAFEQRRILIVEDDARNIFALTSILEPKGAVIDVARNGREALDRLDRAAQAPDLQYDLVLMDIMMPEMDGITAMTEIRKNPLWKRLPIVALTAKAMKDDQEKCIAAGANDYIAKPLDVDKLLSLLRVWLPK